MSTATKSPSLQSDGGTKEDNTLVPEDWDERLRIARAKREKVLAVKAAASKSSKPKKPANRPNMAFDPAEAMALNAAYFQDDDDPVDEPDPVLPAVVPITPLPVEASVTVPSVEALPEIVPQRRLGTTAWVLVACFFGIGVGFALGLGLLIGSGWISPNQLAKPAPAPLNDTTTASLAIVPEPPVPAATLPSISVAQAPIAAAPNLSSVAPNLQSLAPSSYASEMVAQAIMTGPSLAPLPRLPVQNGPDSGPSPLAELTIANLMNVSGRISPKLIITDVGEQTIAILPQPLGSSFTPPPMMAALSIPAPAEVAFVRPVNMARPVELLSAAPDLNTPATEFGDTSLPSLEPYLVSFSPIQAPMIAKASVEQLPTADLAPKPYVPPSLAEIMGLSTEQALTYRLALMAPDNVDAQEVANLSDTLGKTGFPLSDPIRVSYKISKAHIRYYSDADRTIAIPLATSLGIEARDFTGNNTGANKVEIWMAGTSNKRPRVTASNRRNSTPRVSTRTRLNNSILNGLRKVTN